MRAPTGTAGRQLWDTDMAPKLGMGLYGDPDQPQGFNDANLQFARQLGCTHVTLHLPGHKLCPNENGIWQVADLVRCKEQAASHGLVLFAIENFYPQHWYKVQSKSQRSHPPIHPLAGTLLASSPPRTCITSVICQLLTSIVCRHARFCWGSLVVRNRWTT